VLVLKWILVLGSARHIVLTGAHPFQRWMSLPGPRGWFPLVFFLLAVPCFPIWVCFHAGTTGTLLASLTGTAGVWNGGAHLAWGMVALAGVLALSAAGGYPALERVQLVIVLLMLASVLAAAFFLKPEWGEFLKGLLVPMAPTYPNWITPDAFPEITRRPVWLEATTYVGIIGGSSYDYLAYVSYLREKQWGRAGLDAMSLSELAAADGEETRKARQWLRAPLVDCTMSFAAVLVFTAVFVLCGAAVLGPQHKVPGGSDLLTLQAEFVAALHPWFKPVYFAGAFLAIFGTLYGTIEVAPSILRELVAAFRPESANCSQGRLRFCAIGWVGAGGLMILAWSFLSHWRGGVERPPELVAILTPANLFTGVLGCGLICLLNVWADYRFLPRDLRPSKTADVLSLVAGLVFLALGLRGCWDYSGWIAFVILGVTLLLGCVTACVIARWPSSGR
jgi:hypothetical protein